MVCLVSGPVLSAIPRTLSATISGVGEEDNPGYHGPQDVLRSMGFVFLCPDARAKKKKGKRGVND